MTDKETARKYIQYGVKAIVFERLCQNEVVSAVISFAYSKFRTLKFKEVPELQKNLHTCAWIAKLLSQKGHWYQQCQLQHRGESTDPPFYPY